MRIVDLYGDIDCPNNTQSSRPHELCYCTFFNDSWSCPEKPDKLDKKYFFGYFDRHYSNGTGSKGRRFEWYLIFSISEETFRLVIVAVLLATRICEPSTTPTQAVSREIPTQAVSREKSTTMELVMQWKIALGFLLGAFVYRMIVFIMLMQCSTATEVELMTANAVLKIIFMFATGIQIYEYLTQIIPESLLSYLSD